MDEKPVGRGRPLPVAVRERLERTRALVPGLSDRGEKQRLLDPRLRVGEQVRARDEDGVVRRRTRREVRRAGKELRGAVLHRSEDAAVVVAIDRSPRPPLLLGPLHPLALLRLAIAAGLPPHARLADRRRGLERRAGEPGEPRRHRFAGGAPTRSTTTSTDPTLTFAMRSRYSATRCCTSRATPSAPAPHASSTWTSISTVPSVPEISAASRASDETPSTSSAASPA